ncbi:MAG: hypothetical protein WCC99_10740 [Candidatus Sulfotelmatobacter sp.]
MRNIIRSLSAETPVGVVFGIPPFRKVGEEMGYPPARQSKVRSFKETTQAKHIAESGALLARTAESGSPHGIIFNPLLTRP